MLGVSKIASESVSEVDLNHHGDDCAVKCTVTMLVRHGFVFHVVM